MLNTFRGTRGPRATRIGEPPQTAEEREIREERADTSSSSGGAEIGGRRRRRLLQGNVHSLGSSDPELEAAGRIGGGRRSPTTCWTELCIPFPWTACGRTLLLARALGARPTRAEEQGEARTELRRERRRKHCREVKSGECGGAREERSSGPPPALHPTAFRPHAPKKAPVRVVS